MTFSVADKTAEEIVRISDEARGRRQPTVNFEPIGSLVLIRPDAPEAVSAGGVLLPDAAQEKPSQGEVLAIGRECTKLAVGDRVVFQQYTGANVDLEGETLLAVRESEVLGRLTPRLT